MASPTVSSFGIVLSLSVWLSDQSARAAYRGRDPRACGRKDSADGGPRKPAALEGWHLDVNGRSEQYLVAGVHAIRTTSVRDRRRRGPVRGRAGRRYDSALSAAACSWAPPTTPPLHTPPHPSHNVVDDLNRKLRDGSAGLRFEGRSGYLQSAIDALKLPVDSQLLVFSKASLQRRLSARRIRERCSSTTASCWRGCATATCSRSPHTTRRRASSSIRWSSGRPSVRSFKREFRCLGCHMTGDTLGVPGLLMFSTTPDTATGRRGS